MGFKKEVSLLVFLLLVSNLFVITATSIDITSTEQNELDITLYDENELELHLKTSEGGTTEPKPDIYINSENETKQIKAISYPGWKFSHWEGDVEENQTSEKSITMTIDKNKSIQANFLKEDKISGYTLNQDEEILEGVNVTLNAYDQDREKIEDFSTISDENGYFVISNITEIDNSEESGVEFYRINMEKWNEETGRLEYRGVSDSTRIRKDIFRLGERDYYLEEAVKVNVEGIGLPEPLDQDEMIYLENHSVEDYHRSLEWMEDKDQWAYISDGGNGLTILDADFEAQETIDIPVENPAGLHYEDDGVFYTTNSSRDPIETIIWKFNETGHLLESHNITDLTTGRYEKIGGIEYHDGSFYLLGWNDSGTVFDRYSSTFSFEENIFLDEDETPLMVGDIHRHDDYWYYAAGGDIHKRDNEFEKVSYAGHPDSYWWWFPSEEMWGIAHDGNSWYMGFNGTNNISEVQITDQGIKTFEYSVRDYLSEERIASSHHDTGDFVSNFSFYGLADREYMINLHKEDSPLIINQHITDIRDKWNEETQKMNITVNMTEELRRVSGYVDHNGSHSFTNISVVYYEMDERNKADLTGNYNRGRLYNQPDIYEPSEGYYDIAIPHPVEYEETYLLFITAYDESEDQHYGGIQDIVIKGGEQDRTGFNVSLEPLLGEESDLIAHGVTKEGQNEQISTALKDFQFFNSTTGEKITPEDYHSEIYMDYTEYWPDSTEVVWTRDSGDHSTNAENDHFELPVFGREGNRMNLFVYGYSPTGLRLTEENLVGEDPYEITPSEFDPEDVLLDGESEDITISVFRGESADDPYPEEPDVIFSRDHSDIDDPRHQMDFANILLEILGGEMSLRISYEDLAVHYSNVDVSKSGSPDAIFSSEAEIDETLDSLWRFGSTGPDIYDEVLISMPYNESDGVNTTIHIPYLYDEQDWENPIWESPDGIEAIENDPNLRYYREGYLNSAYEAYLNETGVECIENNENFSEGLGYKDTENQVLWAKIPHFSGLGLNVEGETIDMPEFEIDIDSPGEEIEFKEDEEVKINYTVTNIGNLEGMQTIRLEIEGELEESHEEVNLKSGDSYSGQFVWTATYTGEERTISLHSQEDQDEISVNVLKTHLLTIKNPSGEGNIIIGNDKIPEYDYTEKFIEDSEIKLEAIPDEGYEFSHWSGDLEDREIENEKISISIDEEIELTAHFEEKSDEDGLIPGFTISLLGLALVTGYFIKKRIKRKK